MPGLLIILLFVFMLLGVPIAFSFILADASFLQITQIRPLILLAQRAVVGIDSFPLLAIPLFVAGGYLMEETGVSKRIVNWVEYLFGRVRGSMGVVTIVACTIFAALTGSGPATVASIGSLMIPAMVAAGYERKTAAGMVATSGSLGPIIPPSIPMIVYGTTMSLSIPKMFIGGILPGLLIAVLLIAANYVVMAKKPTKKIEEPFTFRGLLKNTWKSLGALCLPIIILGGIYGGIFTPTEAGTICCVYCLVLGLFYKDITLKKLKRVCIKTAETSAIVLFVISSANLFGWLMTYTQLPVTIANAITSVVHTQTAFLIMLTVMLLILGALMDTIVSIVVIAPVVCPIGIALGIDPLHLGIVFCVNLIIGFVTPPFGADLFVASSISGESYGGVVKGSIPFVIAGIIGLLLVTFIPQISLFLPNLAFK